jgi:peptidyl-prolyl cis-trans isomerase D
MLDFMRKHAGTWMIKVLLAAIVVVFVFWGVGSWTSEREGRVATVNGDVISLEEYRSAYNRMLDQARQNFGAAMSDELMKSLQLPQQALEQLIDRALLRQSAARLELRVTDEELARSIRGIEAFRSSGVFDPRRYQQVLSLNRLTPEAYEAGQRESLLIEKLLRVVTDTAKTSEIEAEEWYKWTHSTVKIDYVLVDPGRYEKLGASAEEISQYFDRARESYKTEPEAKVRYLLFKPENYLEKVPVTPEEAREYFEANPERFEVPKTVEARHILVKVGAEAAPEAVEEARVRIQDVLKLARAGKDFAELAKQHSEDGTKEIGGALGAFRREAMVQPFADAAFALTPGEVSEPVRTRFGWHLIKVEKVNEGRTRGFEEVRAEIDGQLRRERARSLAFDEAEAVHDAAYGTGDLAGPAAARKLNLLTTEFFTRRGPVKGVEPGTRFAQAAFELATGDISEVIEDGDSYALLQVVETRPSRVPELAAVEPAVRRDLMREKQAEAAGKDAQAILADVKAGVSLEQAAKKFGLEPKTTDYFKRGDSIAEFGNAAEVVQAAFTLSEGSPLPAEPLKTPKGYCVPRFGGRRTPPPEDFPKEKAKIQEQLLQQKKFKTWEAWLEQLRKAGAIERKQDLIKG